MSKQTDLVLSSFCERSPHGLPFPPRPNLPINENNSNESNVDLCTFGLE